MTYDFTITYGAQNCLNDHELPILIKSTLTQVCSKWFKQPIGMGHMDFLCEGNFCKELVDITQIKSAQEIYILKIIIITSSVTMIYFHIYNLINDI